MSEIPGQRIHGSEMTERECYQYALQSLNGLRTALRGLAAARKDARWLLPVRLLDQMEDSIKRLMTKGGPRVLWLPGRPN